MAFELYRFCVKTGTMLKQGSDRDKGPQVRIRLVSRPDAIRPIEILNRADRFSECTLKPSCLRIIGARRSRLQ
jgi:hypothetical protein